MKFGKLSIGRLIRRDMNIGKYPYFLVSWSLGRNPKAFRKGHWYKTDPVTRELLGCGCGNPEIPHAGIYEDYFYAYADFRIKVGPYQFVAWMNNRKDFGSYYSFSHKLISRFFRHKAARRTGIKNYGDGRYGATFSILGSSSWGEDNTYHFDGLKFQWSREP